MAQFALTTTQWQKIASAGATVEIQCTSVYGCKIAMSASMPALNADGELLSTTDGYRKYDAPLPQDLYALASFGSATIIDVQPIGVASTGGGGGGGGGAVYGPTAEGTAPAQAPIYNGFKDASGQTRGVAPATPLPSLAYDQRDTTKTLDATKTSGGGSFIDIPLNGAASVGLKFVGFAGGAIVSYFSSNDAGATPTDVINSYNAATQTLSPTRSADGPARIPVTGRTTLRLQVTTAGTGTIAVSYNVSSQNNIIDIATPLPPGTNTIGTVTANLGTLNGAATDVSVQQVKTALGTPFQTGGSIGNTSFGISGTLPAFATVPAFKIDQTTPGATNKVSIGTDGAVAATEADGANVTLGSKADAASAATGSTAMSVLRQLHADLLLATPAAVSTSAPTYTTGTTQSLNMNTSGELRSTLSSLPAFAATPTFRTDQSTPGVTNATAATGTDGTTQRQIKTTTDGSLSPATAASGKITRTSVSLATNTSTQLVGANANRIAVAIQCASGGVSVDETGGTLTAAGVGNGTLFVPSGTAPYFTPPVTTLAAITAYSATAQVVVVVEYVR